MQPFSAAIAAFVFLCSAVVVVACETAGSGGPVGRTQVDPSTITRQPDGACAAKVDSQLLQLSDASDPDAFAAQTGIAYTDGLARVTIELNDGVARLSADPQVVVEAQYANFVDARIAPADLCRIAAQPEVARIRLAIPPVAQ